MIFLSVIGYNFYYRILGERVPAKQSGVFTSAPKVRLFNELFCHVVDAIDSRGEKLSQYGQWQCIPRAAELGGKLRFISCGAVSAKSSVKVIFRQKKIYIRIDRHFQWNTSFSANSFRYKSVATFPHSMSFFWLFKSRWIDWTWSFSVTYFTQLNTSLPWCCWRKTQSSFVTQ